MKRYIGQIILICVLILLVISVAPPKSQGGYAETIMPTVYNLTLTDNSTQYAQILPAGTKHLAFLCRDGTTFRYAFVTGKVATPTEPYMTCPANTTVTVNGILTDNLTIYAAGAISGKVVEITCWGP
jgi:hypothetical protein